MMMRLMMRKDDDDDDNGERHAKNNEKNERIQKINEGIWNVSFHYDCTMGSKLVTLNSFVPDPAGAKGRSQMNGFQQNPRKFEPREF